MNASRSSSSASFMIFLRRWYVNYSPSALWLEFSVNVYDDDDAMSDDDYVDIDDWYVAAMFCIEDFSCSSYVKSSSELFLWRLRRYNLKRKWRHGHCSKMGFMFVKGLCDDYLYRKEKIYFRYGLENVYIPWIHRTLIGKSHPFVVCCNRFW